MVDEDQRPWRGTPFVRFPGVVSTSGPRSRAWIATVSGGDPQLDPAAQRLREVAHQRAGLPAAREAAFGDDKLLEAVGRAQRVGGELLEHQQEAVARVVGGTGGHRRVGDPRAWVLLFLMLSVAEFAGGNFRMLYGSDSFFQPIAGAYQPILRRVDEFLDDPMSDALKERLRRGLAAGVPVGPIHALIGRLPEEAAW